MRKSFFKKLSLGLALALVLGTTAQAGTAKAAETWALTKSSKTLYLNDDNSSNTKDNYDFNFKSLPEDWKKTLSFTWEVEDEKIATHSKSGKVQAVSVGETTINCIVTSKKDGKVVAKASADIIVKENAAKIEINNVDDYADAEFAPGAVIDLNRTMYNAAGQATTKRGTLVTDYTRWVAYDYATGEVVGDDVVSINQKNGQFTMHKAGIYVLEVNAYQSSKYPENRVSDSALVVVEDKFVATQKTVNGFDLKLSTEEDAKAINAENFNIFVTEDYENVKFVKSVAVDSKDKTVVHVTLWDNFVDNTDYTVQYGTWTNGVFKANYSDSFLASVGLPVRVELESLTVENEPNVVYTYSEDFQDGNQLVLKFFDKKGINVTSVYGENYALSYVEYDYDVNNYLYDFDFDEAQKILHAYEAGQRYTINVKYTGYNEDGTVRVTDTDNAIFVAQNAPAAKIDTVVKRGFVSLGNIRYDGVVNNADTSLTISATDNGTYFGIAAVDTKGRYVSTYGVDYETINGQKKPVNDSVGRDLTTEKLGFTFYSSNERIATIEETSGYFIPNAQGTVKITVFYTDPYDFEAGRSLVGVYDVTIKADRQIDRLELKTAATASVVSNVVVKPDATKGAIALYGEEGQTRTNVLDGTYFDFVVYDNLGQNYIDKAGDVEINIDNRFFVLGDEYENGEVVGDGSVWNDADGTRVRVMLDIAAINQDMEHEGNNVKTKTYTAKISVAGKEGNAKFEKVVRVTVRKPSNDVVNSYKIDVADVDVAYKQIGAVQEVKVYAFNNEGLKIWDFSEIVAYACDEDGNALREDAFAALASVEDSGVSLGDLFYVVRKGNDLVKPVDPLNVVGPTVRNASATTPAAFTINGNEITLVGAFNVSTTAGDIEVAVKAPVATYKVDLYVVKANKVNGRPEAQKLATDVNNFTVSDNVWTAHEHQYDTKALVSEVGTVGLNADGTVYENINKKLAWTAYTDIKDAVLECFNFTIDNIGGYVNDYPMLMEVRMNADNKLYVKNVKIYRNVGNDTYVEHVVYVGKTITVNQ